MILNDTETEEDNTTFRSKANITMAAAAAIMDTTTDCKHGPSVVSSCSLIRIDTRAAITLVEDAEQAFVEGSFRQALQLANTCLQGYSRTTLTTTSSNSSSTTSASTTSEGTFPGNDATTESQATDPNLLLLETPIQFTFDPTATTSRRLQIQIQLDDSDSSTSSQTDRAAAVAIQSWYEIAIHQTKQEQARGYRLHFTPFLNQYTSTATATKGLFSDSNDKDKVPNTARRTNCSSMSLELLLIFLQFCHATAHFHMATELAAQVLHALVPRTTAKSADSTEPLLTLNQQLQATHCQELLVFVLTELLPRCNSPSEVTELGTRLLATEWTRSSTQQWRIMSSKPNVHVIESILSLLDADHSFEQWLHGSIALTETLSDCRNQLHVLLEQELDMQQAAEDECYNDQDPSPIYQDTHGTAMQPRTSSSFRDTLSSCWQGNDNDSLVSRFTCFLRLRIQTILDNPVKRRATASAAITILTLWMAWHSARRRQRLQQGAATGGGTASTSSKASPSLQLVQQAILKPLLEIITAFAPNG